MEKEQLQAKMEEAARYGKQLLDEKRELEREIENEREQCLEKEQVLNQQVFALKRKLEVAQSTIQCLQDDANERSVVEKKKEAKEMEKVRNEAESIKKTLEEKIRGLEFDVKEKERNIARLENESQLKEELISEARNDVIELKAVRERLKEDNEQIDFSLQEQLKEENFELKQQLGIKDSNEARLNSDLKKFEHLIQESEIEKEDLQRKLASMENDVSKLKEDILGLEQLLENERMTQKTGDERGNSLFGELDDQRKRAEEAFTLLKNRYTQVETRNEKLKINNRKLNADIEGLLLLSCTSQVDAKEYACIEIEVKNLKMETREKGTLISQLQENLKLKDSTIEKLKAEAIKTTSTGNTSEDHFAKFYKNCLEKEKQATAEMEKRWKDEIMEKMMIQDENTKLKFENAMAKRETQDQKANNFRLTMKMNELQQEKDILDPPAPKKQKIIVEKIPEDWKITGSASANSLNNQSTSLKTETGKDEQHQQPSSPLDVISDDNHSMPVNSQPPPDIIPPAKQPIKQKIKVLTEEEGVMKPEECNQQ